MNNDLSNLKVGDYIWTIQSGWTKVLEIDTAGSPVIKCQSTTRSPIYYSLDGKLLLGDSYPSAFIEPPSGFCAEKKPCDFKKGDEVLVSNGGSSWRRRYFSHAKNGSYFTFSDGRTEWSSLGLVGEAWRLCKKEDGYENIEQDS